MKKSKIVIAVLSLVVLCLAAFSVVLLQKNAKLSESVIEFADNDEIIYRGKIIDTNLSIQNTYSPNSMNDYVRENYDGLYNNYSNGSFVGKTVAFTQDSIYEECFEISNVNKIAIANEYNPFLRNVEYYNGEIFKKNTELDELRKKDDIVLQAVKADLDGDGTDEYIVYYKDEKNIDSVVSLYNANGEKIDTLVYMKNAYWANLKLDIYEQFINIENIEVLDIDKDGKMEILVESPAYLGRMLSIFKYDGQGITGDSNIDVGIYLAS